jgi:hypothetical protein
MSEDSHEDASQFSLPGMLEARPGTSAPQQDLQPAPGTDEPQDSPFRDKFEFLDDVHGTIHLNALEVDAIDSPEFQRLFRLGQLGLVDLVFPTANHTRATHSIGVCHLAKRLVDTLNVNRHKSRRGPPPNHDPQVPIISDAERVLIGLAGLLHDIPHGPLSHDIEKKTHLIFPRQKQKGIKVRSHYGPYDKHDNFETNPALYVFLMDTEKSVLARVLRHYSPAFARLLLASDTRLSPHLVRLIKILPELWPGYQDDLLPSLLFHVLVYEKPEEEGDRICRTLRLSFESDVPQEWGLGPKASWQELHGAWYQPFRHDIVGDTLSADLLDYLSRDQARLGMKSRLDLKLLNDYILVPWPTANAVQSTGLLRCAVDLLDHKRGTFRAERLNDLFRLLDLRHQIHEKAVHHRVVQSAIAMLSRSSLIMRDEMPPLPQLYGLQDETMALAGDESFLRHLVTLSATKCKTVHQTIACKLAERRIFRPLMVIPGDRINLLLQGICDLRHPDYVLRELAAIIDSTFFSRFFLLLSTVIECFLRHALKRDTVDAVDDLMTELVADKARLERASSHITRSVIFWTTPYKQLYKDPAILVCLDDSTTMSLDAARTSESASEALRSRIEAGISDAEKKNEALWKFYVFLSDGLFYTGSLARLVPGHLCAKNPQEHSNHLLGAQGVVVRALRSSWQYWQGRKKLIDLEKPSSEKELHHLIEVFLATAPLFRLGDKDIPSLVSAVKVDQYLHANGGAACRDVRYKFDLPGRLDSFLKQEIGSQEKRQLVVNALRATGVDASRWKQEEMAEVVSKLAGVSDDLLSSLAEQKAARNEPVDTDALRSIWRTELD